MENPANIKVIPSHNDVNDFIKMHVNWEAMFNAEHALTARLSDEKDQISKMLRETAGRLLGAANLLHRAGNEQDAAEYKAEADAAISLLLKLAS